MAPPPAPAVPRPIAAKPLRTLRPQDAADIYAQPQGELRRLERGGALHRVARGYYIVVPQDRTGTAWAPSLEAVAAGIATADFGPGNIILMGVSAARLHGAIPRALGTAIVAVPAQRTAVTLIDRLATVRFVKRDVESLGAERMITEIGPVLVTTPEQTFLDLARRPHLGLVDEAEVRQAVRLLMTRSDPEVLEDLAQAQRARATLHRARGWAEGA